MNKETREFRCLCLMTNQSSCVFLTPKLYLFEKIPAQFNPQLGEERINSFLKSISQRVNVIGRLQFELLR